MTSVPSQRNGALSMIPSQSYLDEYAARMNAAAPGASLGPSVRGEFAQNPIDAHVANSVAQMGQAGATWQDVWNQAQADFGLGAVDQLARAHGITPQQVLQFGAQQGVTGMPPMSATMPGQLPTQAAGYGPAASAPPTAPPTMLPTAPPTQARAVSPGAPSRATPDGRVRAVGGPATPGAPQAQPVAALSPRTMQARAASRRQARVGGGAPVAAVPGAAPGGAPTITAPVGGGRSRGVL